MTAGRHLDFRVLGPLEVWERGRPLKLGGAKQRALLAILLLHADQVVSTDRLIEELWGEGRPETAANTLQVYVSQLRKIVGAPALETRPPGYRLRAGDRLDRVRFERLAEEGRRALGEGLYEAAAERLREALALWRGPALAEFAFDTFAQSEILRLEERRLAALEERIDADLALGRADLVGELEALVAEHSLREGLRGQLMLALYRAGRQAEALQVYQGTRATLVEELGIDPSPALQRLERAILQQDPGLEPAAHAATRAPPPVEPAPARESRKTVTVLFADASGSPELERLDPEVLSRALEPWFARARSVLEAHGGSVERLADDRLMAIFGVPTLHEDDPLRASRAAKELHDDVTRVGIATGEVVVREPADEAASVTGKAVSAAASLERAARPGEILLAEPTRRLVAGAARVEEAGAARGAWRLLELDPGGAAFSRRLDAPMVGRTFELEQLRRSFERAVRERTCHLFTVLGPAGIGKSRLAGELRRTLEQEARVLSGRCLPYGEGITFWPLAETVREALGEDAAGRLADLLGDLDAERVEALVGAGELAGGSEEAFRAGRKLLEALARERPLVVIWEDIHWAEASLLDFVEHVAEWARDAPLLLVCLARPELLEARAAWAGGKPNAATLLLEPLSEREVELLIENLAGETPLPSPIRARILEAAEGNPLFVEQMIALAAEEGAPRAELVVPPTIQALLAARIDRLEPVERALLERAAVIGKEFWVDALADLSPGEDTATVDAGLHALVRKELVRPDRATLAGEEGFRFRHLLIRDTAYDALPKERRAGLHERFADWLERKAGDETAPYEEILGYHLEQAYRYRAELGLLDEAAAELAVRAGERLAAAGRRAYGRGDGDAAANLIARAVALLPPERPEQPELLVDLAEALREAGEFARAEAVLADALERAREAGDRAREARAVVATLRMRMQTDTHFATGELLAATEAALRVFEELGDERGLAKAWAVRAWFPWLRCRAAEAEVALERALEHARRGGDERAEAYSLNLLLGVALFGPTPVTEAVRRCEAILAESREQQRIAASAYRALAGLKAMEGRFEEARELLERDRAISEDLGLRVLEAVAAEVWGILELLAGRPEEAERRVRAGYEILEQMGEKSGLSTLAALLAHALHAQGRDDEAYRLTETSAAAAAADDLGTQIQWRSARAKVLARRGEAEEAETLAHAAVGLAEATDFLNLRGDALADLGEVLRLLGRADAAALQRALAEYERKGNAVAAERVRFIMATNRSD